MALSETASLMVGSKASVGSKLGGGGDVFLGIATLAIFGVLIAWFLILNRKTSKKKEILGAEDDSFLDELPKFHYEELTLATNNFSLALACGGSSCVFKGMLGDGSCVAVKRITEGQEHGKREFQAEVAAVGRLNVRNTNIVQLLGYCVVPRGPRFLVYEFIQNGSLDRKLLEALDTRLIDEMVDENVVRKLAYVALWCVQEKVKLRPSMAQVVDMLEGRLPVDEPPETEMFFLDLLVISSGKNCLGQNNLKTAALQTYESDTRIDSVSTATTPTHTAKPVGILSTF
ncbi:hypothetical protein Cgig2_014268 [Carnegiea gigantea]|uniref:Serine-threonine/tyrosine-protein kinase catalytic domain-containing protein n=1 Tax=Carnegiea gigantea TaxID=171969 RepID=A0A9Q1GLH7_9CARY|nr:hypothetical protein Cgig2_014268 [Carnegiea gigantea]